MDNMNNNADQKSKEVIELENNNQNGNFEKLDLSSEQKKAIEKILVMNDSEIAEMMKVGKQGKDLKKYFSLPNTVFAISTIVFCLLSITFISIVKSPVCKGHFEMARAAEGKMIHEKHFPPKEFGHCPGEKFEGIHEGHEKHFHKRPECNFKENKFKEPAQSENNSQQPKENA